MLVEYKTVHDKLTLNRWSMIEGCLVPHLLVIIVFVGCVLQLWLDGYQGRGLAVKEIFDGYKAVTDWPAADFYQV